MDSGQTLDGPEKLLFNVDPLNPAVLPREVYSNQDYEFIYPLGKFKCLVYKV